MKDQTKVKYLPQILLPTESSEEVQLSSKYVVISTINHSGTIHAGHYWANIKNIKSSTWYTCNDRSVIKINPDKVNNSSVYVLFYCRI